MNSPQVRAFFDPNTATWSYVVWSPSDAARHCAIIDSVLDYDLFSSSTTTQSADYLIEFVKENDLAVQWILETHIHADHITAAKYIQEQLGGRIGVSRHILAILETWEGYFQNSVDTPLDGSQFDHLFADGEMFRIGDLEAAIIHTPGHTPADTSYIIGDAVFVGDSMFLPDVGSGRCDFPGGSAEDSYASSRVLLALPDNFRMYVGHDYPPGLYRTAQCMATIAEQKAHNVRFSSAVNKADFVAARRADDTGKAVPQLLLPSIQANLRGGAFGQAVNGIQYMKLPMNRF